MLYVSRGEEMAFEELYLRYSKRLMVYFSRMLNFNRVLAEDALQDLFMKIAEHPDKFDRNRSFKTWIFSVASNTCKNYYRHKQVITKTKEDLNFLKETQDENSFVKLASKMDAQKFRQTLELLLNELPLEKKEAFILKYQEERSIEEIAFIQNCPEGSVKSRLHYTLKVLEEKLKLFKPVND